MASDLLDANVKDEIFILDNAEYPLNKRDLRFLLPFIHLEISEIENQV
jgi:hypothetical protein